jgi:hypothetical protein
MPDYMFQLESRLSPEQRAAMVRIQELATESESNLYLVGGAVRDVVSGMSIRDLDFTIEGNPARMVRELEKGGAKVAREDESLRTAELLLSGEVDASISAAREDIYARPGAKPEEVVEQIDIGGPSMLRSAAKNFEFVTVVVDPADYGRVLAALEAKDDDSDLRRLLAEKVFARTAAYDAAIAYWFGCERSEIGSIYRE